MDGFEYGQSFKWLLWFLLLEYGFMAALLEPGFLDFDNLPDTNFTCVGKVIGGYYADLETACQMFHVCTIGQLDEPMDIRFLCLNGTVFDQETRVCERIDEVDCAKSEQFYSLNLELYGNTQAPILSESEEQDGLSSTSTSRTPSTSSEAKVTRQNFIITTAKPTKSTELYKPHTTPKPSTTSRYRIPINRPPDIRFNPKEINVSLSVRDSDDSEEYHHQYHGTSSTARLIEYTTQKPPTKIVRNNSPVVKPTARRTTTTEHYETEHYIDFQKEPSRQNHQPLLRNNYHYRLNVPNFRPSGTGLLRHHQHQQNKYSNQPTIFYSPPQKQQQYSSTPTKNQQQRLSVLQPSQTYYNNYKHEYVQTETAPVKIQLELPTRQPLTFSSPSPFRLSPQNQQKQHHRNYGHQAPRIVISASASVSDASGRKFNYSLGTIGDSQLFGHAPQSYDDYREEDVGFDPFYHDVLKLNRAGRRKREVQDTSTDAIDTLRFLFEWYNQHKDEGGDNINTRWNSSLSNGSKKYSSDFRARNDDVIYKSVIDTIKQNSEPSHKVANFEDYQDYVQEDFVKATGKADFDEQNHFNADSPIKISNDYKESVKDYEEDSFANFKPNKTMPQALFTRSPYFEDQEGIENITKYINNDEYPEDIDPLTNADYIPQNYEIKFESTPFSKLSFDKSNDTHEIPNVTDWSNEEFATEPNEFNKPTESSSLTMQNHLDSNTTSVYSTELNEHVLEITDRYLQVLNILGITTSQNINQTTTQPEETTRTSEDVLESPINTPEPDHPTESLPFAIDGTLPTSQTERIDIKTTHNGVSIIFGAKVKVERTTTPEPTTYKEENSQTTSSQNVLTVAMTTSTLNDKLLDSQSLSELMATISNVPVVPTTLTPKSSTKSIVRNSNHRFNRFRSNTRNRQRYATTKATTSTYKTPTSHPSEATTNSNLEQNQLLSPRLVSETYTIQNQIDSQQGLKDKSVDMYNKIDQLKNYIFNCFGRDLNEFYSDPRDCRLFHYCTKGYTSTQLLDMKFVCDSGTFFDNEKLVCTKIKPSRCI